MLSHVVLALAAASIAIADPCTDASASYWVSASTAHACELAVPFNQNRSQSVISTVQKFYNTYYSTENYFIHSPNPRIPSDYNLAKRLNTISRAVNNSHYKTDWDFTINVADALNREHDGHTTFFPSCAYAFSWNIPVSIATLAKNPADASSSPYFIVNYDFPVQNRPNLETYYKGLGYNYRKYDGLLITQINGEDASQYLINLATQQSILDAGLYTGFESVQARYMRLMTRYSADTASGAYTQEVARFAQRGFYPAATSVNITVMKNNGKEETVYVPWSAHFTGSGNTTASFAANTCFPAPAAGGAVAAAQPVLISGRNEKRAVIEDGTQAIMKEIADIHPVAGVNYVVPNLTSYGHITTLDFYRLEKHPKVGVMYFEQFEPSDGTSSGAYFQGVSDLMYTALTQLKKDGVEHLIIDQSGNRGGYIQAGAIALWSLFPNDLYPGFPAVFRDLDLSRRESDVAAQQGPNSQSDYYYGDYRDLNYNYLQNNSQFMDPPVPMKINGVKDAFSHPFFDDFGDNSTAVTNFTAPPFAPEDIIFVANSICGSTCSVFSSYLFQKHGIRSAVFGGLPNQTLADAQFDAGVKGSEVIGLGSILYYLQATGLQNDPAAPQPLPINTASSNCNYRNAIPYVNATQDKILEFSFDSATKHFQFTKHTYNLPQQVWEYAAGQFWGMK